MLTGLFRSCINVDGDLVRQSMILSAVQCSAVHFLLIFFFKIFCDKDLFTRPISERDFAVS
jgi:hypothetical protein